MAELSIESRYRQSTVLLIRIYEEEETDLKAAPIRRERSLGGRFTTWAAPEDSFDYVVLPGDSMPSLARRFYRLPTRWHIIADMNPQVLFPLDLVPNTVLTMPPLRVAGKIEAAL